MHTRKTYVTREVVPRFDTLRLTTNLERFRGAVLMKVLMYTLS